MKFNCSAVVSPVDFWREITAGEEENADYFKRRETQEEEERVELVITIACRGRRNLKHSEFFQAKIRVFCDFLKTKTKEGQKRVYLAKYSTWVIQWNLNVNTVIKLGPKVTHVTPFVISSRIN